MWSVLPVYVHLYHIHAYARWCQKRHWNLQSWSYRWLGAIVEVLGIKPTKPASAVNHKAISPISKSANSNSRTSASWSPPTKLYPPWLSSSSPVCWSSQSAGQSPADCVYILPGCEFCLCSSSATQHYKCFPQRQIEVPGPKEKFSARTPSHTSTPTLLLVTFTSPLVLCLLLKKF